MNRRDFLRTAGIASAGLALPKSRRLFADSPTPAGWRTFEVTTRVEVLKPNGTTRVWLPAALIVDTPYQKTSAAAMYAPDEPAAMNDAPARTRFLASR